MRKTRASLAALVALWGATAAAQPSRQQILKEFAEMLALPNVAANPEDIRRNAAWLEAAFQRRGVKTRLLEAPGARPAVYGELLTPGATRTVVFYAHYDGQPVDPRQWTMTGNEPFRPVLRDRAGKEAPLDSEGLDGEWRLYGRSTSDDKGAIMAFLAALDRLKAEGRRPSANIKFFLEGEEEAGSPGLTALLTAHRELLKADLWFICDGPVYQNRQQQVVFGVRGVSSVDITVYGPVRELHSGHYGNWAPNPALLLTRLLASMKDDDGRILIEGFSEGVVPLTATERAALAATPDIDAELMKELGLARVEGGGRKLIELLQQPSLNIRGLQSVAVGDQARNVVPAEARASIDIRLVKGLGPREAFDRLVRHMRQLGYHVVDREPDMETRLKYPKIALAAYKGGYPAARTPMDAPFAAAVVRAVEKARGPVVRTPTLGGSVPLYMLEEALRAPWIGIPIANHDNNQHSFNENIRLQNLWDGIDTMAALMTM